MNTHDIELPAEFRSGNSVPVAQATIKRERMEEILCAAIEADRKRRGEPGVLMVQEADTVPHNHPEYGPGIFFTEDAVISTDQQPAEPSSGEPVAWLTPGMQLHLDNPEGFADWKPLYTAPQPSDPDAATIADYEAVLSDHSRLVRELDVLLNGEEGAAKQASLCDIVAQVRREGIKTAEPVKLPSGLIERLMECADDPEHSHTDYADTMRWAAQFLARYGQPAP